MYTYIYIYSVYIRRIEPKPTQTAEANTHRGSSGLISGACTAGTYARSTY